VLTYGTTELGMLARRFSAANVEQHEYRQTGTRPAVET
jgi:hypothetical protein